MGRSGGACRFVSPTWRPQERNGSARAPIWVAPLITGIVGLVSGISLSLFQSDLSENRYFVERQVETSSNIATQISKYVQSWRRLRILRLYFDSLKPGPTTEQLEQFYSIVADRDGARAALFSEFDKGYLYYGRDTVRLIERFRIWDEKQATKTISELPGIEEWKRFEREILQGLRKELVQ